MVDEELESVLESTLEQRRSTTLEQVLLLEWASEQEWKMVATDESAPQQMEG